MAEADVTATMSKMDLPELMEEFRVSNLHLSNALTLLKEHAEDECETLLLAARRHVNEEFAVYKRLEEIFHASPAPQRDERQHKSSVDRADLNAAYTSADVANFDEALDALAESQNLASVARDMVGELGLVSNDPGKLYPQLEAICAILEKSVSQNAAASESLQELQGHIVYSQPKAS